MQDSQKQQQQQIRKYKSLLQKISYIDDSQSHQKKYKYSNESIQPFVYFWKLLALKPCQKSHKHKLILNIPDTIVFNDGDNPIMWFYTNQHGQVSRLDNVPYHQITTKLTQAALEKELVAVLKKASFGYNGLSGNDIKLISASQMKNVLSIVLGARGQLNIIQKYVKSASVKPSIIRTVWRSNGISQCWVINSNYQYNSQAKVLEINKFIVNTKNRKAFRAVKSVSEKFTKQTLYYLNNIVHFVGRHLNIKFHQFVGDFIKDEGGNLWFINTKAFIINTDKKVNFKIITMHDDDPVAQKQKKKLETYTKCKKCKYCYKIIAQHFMTHKLTLMMILQCDQYLIQMGKNFKWLERCYNQHVGSVNLYIEHKVCDSCYKFYKSIQNLIALQTKMAKLMGIKIISDNRNVVSITSVPSFQGYSPQFGSRLPKVKYDTEMPQGWSLPDGRQLQFFLANEKSQPVQKCRFMVFVHGIVDIPISAAQDSNHYSIQYKIFGQKIKYRISFKDYQKIENNCVKINLNKIRLFYFFCQNRDKIKQFIHNSPLLQIQLLMNNQTIGNLGIQLKQFNSNKVVKRDFFKTFSGPKIFPYLSWGLYVSLGLHQGQEIQSSRLKLVRKDNLLFPEEGYHNSDPLPEQWIQMISEKETKTMQNLSLLQLESNKFQQTSNRSNPSFHKQLHRQIFQYSKRNNSNASKIHRKPYY